MWVGFEVLVFEFFFSPNNFQQSFTFFNVIHLGSVWIGLILLKLKIYCWNHCSKIIFKCVNSTVRPIFNEKVAKKWNLWIHKQYMIHCLLQKSQHLRLLFIKQYINSNHILTKRVKKKKKKQTTDVGSKRRSKHTLILADVNANMHDQHYEKMFESSAKHAQN